ncbi:MAG TPA: thymidine phosphorylase [Candidatus Acidoferrum sp.]|nr:thymidine phosphorylase [Candidatus Acidoferrum sp.]
MNCLTLIESKRDGQSLSPDDIRSFVTAYVRSEVPDYQVAALLMAIFFRGLNAEETRVLTAAMRDSGDVLKFPADPRPLVDKHSTGGIGDKVSLPLAPLLACLGFRVPMISGRGLGITGGTLDKLESIPGFTTQLTREQLIQQVQGIGVAMGGQTPTMVPADRLLYALRDVTGTVPSIPLITASILSKKLAEDISALLLDVKFGCAAFMQTREQARELAANMTRIANEFGVKTHALLTEMNAPLGRAAGNWLEVKESVECLENRGPNDLRELVIVCAARLLVLTGKSGDMALARAQAGDVLASGAPRRKWDELLAAQGADLDAFTNKLQQDHTAPFAMEVQCKRSGFVTRCDARIIGEIIRDLGGGRIDKCSVIDSDVGVDQIMGVGAEVRVGHVLCRIHARTQQQASESMARVQAAFEIADDPVRCEGERIACGDIRRPH